VDFYQVWVHQSEAFSQELVDCLAQVWPMGGRTGGARCEVVGLEPLSTEQLGVLDGEPWLYGVSVKHDPRLLKDEAHQRLLELPGGPVHRGAEAFLADPAVARLSQRLGGALVLAFRDSPAMAYAAIFRRGRCDWSYYLAPGGRVARCDGRSVFLGEEAQVVQPDGDRLDLLLLGLEKFAGGCWQLSEDLRMVLPELLSEGT